MRQLLQNAMFIANCDSTSLYGAIKKSFPKIMLTDREDVGAKEVVDRI